MRSDEKHNLRGVICLLFDLHSLFCDSRCHHKGMIRNLPACVVLFPSCEGTLGPFLSFPAARLSLRFGDGAVMSDGTGRDGHDDVAEVCIIRA